MSGGILNLDLGADFGWAYFEGSERPLWGHVRIAVKGDKPGKVGAALEIFLEARIEVLQPAAIAFESIYVPVPRKPRWVKGGSPFVFGAEIIRQADFGTPMNANTLARLYGMSFLIWKIAYQHRLPCVEVTTGEFCRHFLGRAPPKGRPAKKAANVEMCRMRGWTPVTQDEADSLALGDYTAAKAPMLFPGIRLAMGRPAGPLFAARGR